MNLRTTPQGPGGFTGTGGGFQTDTGTMNSAGSYVQESVQTMIGHVNSLLSELEALNPSTWDGEASKAFYSAKDQWHGVHLNLTKTGGQIGDFITQGSQKYGQADSDLQTGIGNVTRGLT